VDVADVDVDELEVDVDVEEVEFVVPSDCNAATIKV